MPIDSSIYQSVKPPQINMPSPLDSAEKAMTLGQLGMKQQQMQLQMRQQQALRQAYVQNTDASGQVDNPGVSSTLGKMGYGQMANEQAASFAKQQKDQAEAQASAIDTQHKSLNLGLPILGDFIHNVPDDQKATTWPEYLKRMTAMGVQTQNFPKQYDPNLISSLYVTGSQTKEHIDNLKAQSETRHTDAETGKIPSEIVKNNAEARLAPAKLAAEQFGSRAPVVTATDQYSNEPAIKTARNSAVAMGQMLHNYDHRSPQGDVSLMITAYKIKNPDKPDVNSLEELQKAEGAPEQWKNAISHRVNGLFSQGVVDDLMRDAYSAYGPNVQGARDTQQKYQDWAKNIGIPAPNTAEPSMDKTYSAASALMKKLGPYVPPTERGGYMGAISGAASNLMSKVSGAKGASDQITSTAANAKPAPQYRAAGAKVSGDEVAQYAHKHGKTVKAAQEFLKGQGYVVGD